MNYLFVLSCLFAACLTASLGQSSFISSTIRTTPRQTGTTPRQTVTTPRQTVTTRRPSVTTPSSVLKCVCSCCSGLRCKPVALQSFVDATCTTKACQEKCKIFEPKHCDHTFLGTNDAYCAFQF